MIFVGGGEKLGSGLHVDGPASGVKAHTVHFETDPGAKNRSQLQRTANFFFYPIKESASGGKHCHAYRCCYNLAKWQYSPTKKFSNIQKFNRGRTSLNFTSCSWCVAPPAVHKVPLPSLPKHSVLGSIWLVCKNGRKKLKTKMPYQQEREREQRERKKNGYSLSTFPT